MGKVWNKHKHGVGRTVKKQKLLRRNVQNGISYRHSRKKNFSKGIFIVNLFEKGEIYVVSTSFWFVNTSHIHTIHTYLHIYVLAYTICMYTYISYREELIYSWRENENVSSDKNANSVDEQKDSEIGFVPVTNDL